ncbi:MAG: aminoglycoside 6-adenylyltransferase [Candidatus Aegiribacteria sp.]|nr:aminoglycoside 6-adenylyltransferase [Candidatus Aegiribacteria sp.]
MEALHKDDRVPYLPPANESGYIPSRPTADLYYRCCTSFYFALGSHIPKPLWRKQMPLLKFYIECWLRETVLMMFGWEIGFRTGWERSPGPKGRNLETLLPPDVWDEYLKTYVGSYYKELWESLTLISNTA